MESPASFVRGFSWQSINLAHLMFHAADKHVSESPARLMEILFPVLKYP